MGRHVRAALVAALLLFLAASRWLDFASFGILPAIQALWVPLAGLTIVAALILLGKRSPRGLFVVAPALVLFAFGLGQTWSTAPPTVPPDPDRTLTVVSVNLQRGQGRLSDVANEVDVRKADVVVLVEADEPTVHRLLRDPRMAAFTSRTPTTDADSVGSSAILSRRPLVEAEADFDAVRTQHLQQPSATVNVAGRAVRIQAVHAYPPILDGATSWRAGLRAVEERTAAWQRRGPVVVAGDFNGGSSHPAVRRAMTGMEEPTALVWHGFATTWPALVPFVRLDHIYSHGFGVADAGTFTVRESDHRGVWSQLVLAD